ncbi:MAG: hydrogenase maturation nickel metallochaperone HypA [Candidatus Brocadiia bacterium]|nr:MAG: hydrogenase maturation nickel metallochaperone HypA [Candidatus Brocadiia bacterium]
MHETMVAEGIWSAISAETEKQKARPVIAKITCGMLNAVNDEVLNFAFEAIAKGTNCENVRLEIEHKPLQGRCRNCGISFDIELSRPECASCQSEDFELLPDPPITLEEIELETE